MTWQFNQRMIYSDKITEFLQSLLPPGYFLGCFPRDALPFDCLKDKAAQEWSLIVNLDTSDQPGSHYVAFVFYNNILHVYDSVPNPYHLRLLDPEIHKILQLYKLHEIPWGALWLNSLQHQSTKANSCGYFCIWFILKFNIVKPQTTLDVDKVIGSLQNTSTRSNERIIIQELQDLIETYVRRKHKNLQCCLLQPVQHPKK